MTHDDRASRQHPQPVKLQPTTWRDLAQWQSLRAPSGRTVQINKVEAEFIRMLLEIGYAKAAP